MKTEDLILIAAGVAAAYVIWRTLRPVSRAAQPYATKITEYDGYNYFTDGTVIAPNGDYFYQGNLLWSAAQ